MNLRRFLALSFFLMLAGTIVAAGAGELRQRMKDRLPAIDRLKVQQAIGEANTGYLQTMKAGVAEADQLVSAENADRREVYAAIASQTGTSAEAVGQARAKQIAANSHAGVYVQDQSGKWSVKK